MDDLFQEDQAQPTNVTHDKTYTTRFRKFVALSNDSKVYD